MQPFNVQDSTTATAIAAATTVTQANTVKSFIITGLLLVLSLSLYDIHLRPSIAPVSVYEKVKPNAYSKRLVLIISDGLRADIALKDFDTGRLLNMPRLRSKLNREDSICMISMANAPTESRPNHVAMLGGFPEQLSNIFNGWASNGQEFDHILTRAPFSFAFGGPDVVNFFKGPNVHIESFLYERYHTERDPSILDLWAVERFEALLEDSKTNPTLSTSIKSEGVIFLLHLSAVDTNGHRYGALSSQYRDNAQYVDALIEKIETMTNDYFEDEKTTFIFTSDHGFPDVGSHDLADLNSRKCPFVAWGGPGISIIPGLKDCNETFSQRQIASFITTMIGLPSPTNNIALPLVEAYSKDVPESVIKMLIASYGQLVKEFCAQTVQLSNLSTLAGMYFHRVCLNDQNNLKNLEDTIMMNRKISKDSIEIIQGYLVKVSWSRWLLFFFKGLLAGVPFAMGSLGIALLATSSELANNQQGSYYLFKPSSRILWSSIFVALIWFLLFYKSVLAFICVILSVNVLALTFQVNLGDIPILSSLLVNTLLISLVLWSPKFWFVPLLFATLKIYNYSKLHSLRVLCVGIGLFCPVLLPQSMIRHLIPIFGVPYCLKFVFHSLNPSTGDTEGLVIKIILILLGVFLKVRLILEKFIPSLSPIIAITFLFIFYAFIALAYRALRRRSGTSNTTLEVTTCATLGLSSIFALLTVLVDGLLCFTVAAVLFYTVIKQKLSELVKYEPLGVVTGKFEWRSHGDWLPIILLLTTPLGLTALIERDVFSLGPIGRLLGFPNQVQVPISALIGFVLWSLVAKFTLGNNFVDFFATCQKIINAASGLVLIIMMGTLPHEASWLQIGTAISKVFFVAFMPAATSIILQIVTRIILSSPPLLRAK